MWPMSDDIRRNNLLAYEPLTRADGPAMTWSMHSIGFTELGDFGKAEQLFRRSYETYVRPPFNVRDWILFAICISFVLLGCFRSGLKLNLELVQLILLRVLEDFYKRFFSVTVVYV